MFKRLLSAIFKKKEGDLKEASKVFQGSLGEREGKKSLKKAREFSKGRREARFRRFLEENMFGFWDAEHKANGGFRGRRNVKTSTVL